MKHVFNLESEECQALTDPLPQHKIPANREKNQISEEATMV